MGTISNIYAPAKAYVKAAIELLSRVCPATPPETMAGLRDWVRSENVFVMRDREVPYWSRGISSRLEVLHALPEHKLFLQALSKDAAAARHVGVVITARGGRHIKPEELTDRVLWKMVQQCGGFVFDVAAFDALFAEFDADLHRESIDYVAVAPIPRLNCEKLQTIPLGTDFELAQLSDDELIKCLGVSIYPNIDFFGVVSTTPNYGLRHRFSLNKYFGVEPPEEEKKAAGRHEAIIDRFHEVLNALRVFKPGNISIPGFVVFSKQWPVESILNGSPIDPAALHSNNYELANGEGEKFSLFWKAFEDARGKPFLDAAIRRFGYAGERRRAEDRLVDLIISAESLFLSDAGETKERGELRFRLSLRFAFFAKMQGYGRLDQFRLMRNAYDARSSVVHGGQLDESTLKLAGQGKVPLAIFVDTVEDAIRNTLHVAIETEPLSKTKLLDWEKLILAG